MSTHKIISEAVLFVQDTLKDDYSGHDWQHIERVWRMAIFLAKKENANLFIVEISALLHDIADWKFHNGDEKIGPNTARAWLEQHSVDENDIAHICEIIRDISFKGANVKSNMSTLEGKIVQDADRLDAIGAIGIARAFSYGGSKNRRLYDLSTEPHLHSSFDEYKKSESNTINHFHEKLLLLKSLINTQSGKNIAEHRHKILVNFLEEFMNEAQFKYESSD